MRETGPKGCLLVTVDSRRSLAVEFCPLDVLRWQVARVDAEGALGSDDLLERIGGEIERLHLQAAGRPSAMRVELLGISNACRDLLAHRRHWTHEHAHLGFGRGQGRGLDRKIEAARRESFWPPRAAKHSQWRYSAN